MQASMADPAFQALADRVIGLWDRLISDHAVTEQYHSARCTSSEGILSDI